jgi:hypothetical protein
MDIGFGQIQMILTITGLSQFLKMQVLDKRGWVWGRRNKVTVTLVYVASFIMVYINYEGVPLRALLEATIFYGLLSVGAYGTLKGLSRVAKNKL